MTTWTLLIVVCVVPVVVDAIERARQRAGLSHKELAISQGLSAAHWSQQLHGGPGSHVWLDRLFNTPTDFFQLLMEELCALKRCERPLTARDVLDLIQPVITQTSARASTRRETS
jgi:hypothetical protein